MILILQKLQQLPLLLFNCLIILNHPTQLLLRLPQLHGIVLRCNNCCIGCQQVEVNSALSLALPLHGLGLEDLGGGLRSRELVMHLLLGAARNGVIGVGMWISRVLCNDNGRFVDYLVIICGSQIDRFVNLVRQLVLVLS